MAKSAIEEIKDFFSRAAQAGGEAVSDLSRNFSRNVSAPQRNTIDENNVSSRVGAGLGSAAGTVWDNFVLNPKNLRGIYDESAPINIFHHSNLNKLGQDPLITQVTQGIPKAQFSQGIENPYLRFGASIPESIINSFGQSPEASRRFAAQVGTPGYDAKKGAADLFEGIVDPALNLATFGTLGFAKDAAGKVALKQGLSATQKAWLLAKIGAKEGGIVGAGYGLSQGVKENKDVQDMKDYFKNVAMSTGTGGTIGAITGGTLAGTSYLVGNKVSQFFSSRKAKGLFNELAQNADAIDSGALRTKIDQLGIAETPFGKKLLEAADKADSLGQDIQFAFTKARGKLKQPDIPSISFVDKAAKEVTPDLLAQTQRDAVEQAVKTGAKIPAGIDPNYDGTFATDLQKQTGRKLILPEDVGLDSTDPSVLNRVLTQGVDSNGVTTQSLFKKVGEGIWTPDDSVKLKALPEIQDAINQAPDIYKKYIEKGLDAGNIDGARGALSMLKQYLPEDQTVGLQQILANADNAGNLLPGYKNQADDSLSSSIGKYLKDESGGMNINAEVVNPLDNPTKKAAQEALGVAPPADATGDAVQDAFSTPKASEVSGFEKIGKKAEDNRNIFTKAKDAAKEFYVDWVNDRQYAEDWAKKLGLQKKMESSVAGMDGVGSRIDDTLNNKFFPILKDVGQNSKDDFKGYLVAMHDMELADNGIPGSNKEIAQNALAALRSKLGDEEFTRVAGLADRIYDFNRTMLKENLLDTGIIDDKTYNYLINKWKYYVPFKRVMGEFNPFEDLDKYMSFGSASPQSLLQKVKGSERLIEDPVESLTLQYGKMIAAAQHQKFSNVVFDMAEQAKGTSYEGMFNILRNADDVTARKDIMSQIKMTGKERRAADRLIQTRNSWAKTLQNELNDLNQSGYDAYIQKAKQQVGDVVDAEKTYSGAEKLVKNVKDAWAYSEQLKPLKDSIRSLLTDQKGDAVQLQQELNKLNTLGLKQYLKDGAEGLPSYAINSQASDALNTQQTMKLFKGLISKDSKQLAAIKTKIGTSNARLAQVIDNVTTLKDMLKSTKELRPLQGKLQSVVNTLEKSLTDAQVNFGGLSDNIGKPKASQTLSAKQTRDLINQLIQEEPAKIQAIKNKIATRDVRFSRVLDEINTLKKFSDEALSQIKGDQSRLGQLADVSKRIEDSVVTRYHNGVVERMKVPHDLAYSVNAMGAERMNSFLQMFSDPTNFFRMTATGLNPDFWARNVFRDTQTAMANGLSGPTGFASGLYHMLRNDDVYKQFLAGGGTPRRFFDLSPKNITNMADDAFGVDALNPVNVGRKTTFAIKDAMEYLGKMAELPLRIDAFEREYKKAMVEGIGRDYAMGRGAWAAQNVTVNWSRRGAKMPPVNAVYAFLNARLQGADLFARNMINKPAQTTARLTASVLVPSFLLYEYNRNFPRFFDPRVVSEYDKKNNFIIMLPFGPVDELGGAEFMKIPKAEVGKIANPLETFLHKQDGQLDSIGGDNAQNNTMVETLMSFLPVDWNSQNSGVENMTRILLPTALQPLANVAFNKDLYTGLPVVQDNQIPYADYGGQKFQYNSWTSPFYRYVADVIDAGTDWANGGDQGNGTKLSPAQIQAIVQGYGTGWANIFANVYSGLPDAEKYKGQNGSKEKGADVSRIPVVRGLFGGEKFTQTEYQEKLMNKGTSIGYDIQDISKGIAKGRIPPAEGQQMIRDAVQEQIKAMNKATGVTTPELPKVPTINPQNPQQQGLIPSAEAITMDQIVNRTTNTGVPDLQQMATNKLMDTAFRQAYSYNPTDETAKAFGKDPVEARYEFVDGLVSEDKAKYISAELAGIADPKKYDEKVLDYIDRDILTDGVINDMLQRKMNGMTVEKADYLKELIDNYKIALGLQKPPKGKKPKKYKAPSGSIIRSKIGKTSAPKGIKLGGNINLSKIKLSNPKSTTKISLSAPKIAPLSSTYRPTQIKKVKRISITR